MDLSSIGVCSVERMWEEKLPKLLASFCQSLCTPDHPRLTRIEALQPLDLVLLLLLKKQLRLLPRAVALPAQLLNFVENVSDFSYLQSNVDLYCGNTSPGSNLPDVAQKGESYALAR